MSTELICRIYRADEKSAFFVGIHAVVLRRTLDVSDVIKNIDVILGMNLSSQTWYWKLYIINSNWAGIVIGVYRVRR